MREDWELFAAGCLDADQHDEMTAHLTSGCEDCARLHNDAQAVLLALANLAPQLKPPDRVARRLEQRIKKKDSRVRWAWWRSIPWAFAAVCFAGAVWLAVHVRGLELRLARAEVAMERAQTTQAPAALPPPAIEKGPEPSPPDRQQRLQTQLREETRRRVEAVNAKEQVGRDLAASRSMLDEAGAAKQRIERELAQARDRNAELEKQTREFSARAADLAKGAARDARRMETLNTEVAELKGELHRSSDSTLPAPNPNTGDRVAALLSAGDVRQIELKGVDAGAGRATARALYSPEGGLLLSAKRLPPLANHKCYQLWIVRRGNPAILSAGLLRVGADGEGELYAPPGEELKQLTALAITDEPDGGSVSARGHKLLFGVAAAR